MLKQTLRNAFDEMTTALRGIPNVTADMLIFTGHSDDIDTLDYFYYEGILPAPMPTISTQPATF